jgi:hypothetical protein
MGEIAPTNDARGSVAVFALAADTGDMILPDMLAISVTHVIACELTTGANAPKLSAYHISRLGNSEG